ncbi:MAG: EamA family transporter, partial [Pseudoruegeria sp.]
MHLLLLTVLTMIAFAGNSVLNRLALAGAAIDPASFALIRTIAGAAMLSVLVVLRGNGANLRSRPDHWAVLSLVIYMIGFSYAYVTLDAGIGALILFGVVQVTMFAGAIVRGNRVP